MEPRCALTSITTVLDKCWVMIRSALPPLLQFGQDNFLSESALEAIQAGRAEVAATLVDLGEACHGS